MQFFWLSDYNKGLLTKRLIDFCCKICKEAGVISILDPKRNDFTKYKGVDIIKPNKKEAPIDTGIKITNQESLEKACKKIQEDTLCKIVTLSKEGIAYFANEQLHVIPTRAMGVVDVTGAGDTVFASLGFALAKKASLKEACEFANKAAALVVSKVGSSTTTLEKINNHFLNN